MAQPDSDRALQQCLLDRLIDLEPASGVEPPSTRAQSLRQFKAAVRRDLEWLLNTHRSIDEIPETYKELPKSVFVYGLPDLAGVALQSAQDERRLVRMIETAISTFEPRLTRVRVTPRQAVTKSVHSLAFQIEAMLLIDPAPERISFDTVLEVARGAYEVTGI
jgi:type VI secretion system protein ImpF